MNKSPDGELVWFDSHLDLAYLALTGRDMLSENLSTCGGPDLPAAVTLPSLVQGRVQWCLGTIFTEADGKDAVGYPAGDAAAAHARGLEQLEVYEKWEKLGLIERWMGAGKGGKPPALATQAGKIKLGILIEGADPISSPAELSWWVQRGVVAIGLAWAKSSRYAGGNSTDDPLTVLGIELIEKMDRLGVVHDVSHLSDVSLDTLFDVTGSTVIASHSNCRSLIDTDGERRQRHLTDETIREIGRRGGMIGVNVFSPFIIAGARRDRRATLAEWGAHVERICQVQGSRRGVGLGTDMDGGFSASMCPEGINKPADLDLLAQTLAGLGWNDEEIRGFAFENYVRFWSGRHAQVA